MPFKEIFAIIKRHNNHSMININPLISFPITKKHNNNLCVWFYMTFYSYLTFIFYIFTDYSIEPAMDSAYPEGSSRTSLPSLSGNNHRTRRCRRRTTGSLGSTKFSQGFSEPYSHLTSKRLKPPLGFDRPEGSGTWNSVNENSKCVSKSKQNPNRTEGKNPVTRGHSAHFLLLFLSVVFCLCSSGVSAGKGCSFRLSSTEFCVP